MRELVLARRAGVLAAAAACGAIVATPALADVSVSPTTAAQESGENFTFHVTNSGTEPIGTVTLTMPDDTPVAEVYPLSVDDWAPKITSKKLSSPLASLHDDIPTDNVTASITWIAMPGRSLAPGRSADLTIAIGPLPDVTTMRFTLATAYVDGKAGPAMTPAAVTLSPPTAAQQAAEHAEHGGDATATDGTDGTDTSAADAQTASENAAFAKAVNDATRGPSFWSIAGPVVAVLALIGGGWLMWRSRHRAEPDEEPDDTQPDDKATPPAAATDDDQQEQERKEPATAGRWSFKG